MDVPIEEDYFSWLLAKVVLPRSPHTDNYYGLLLVLHTVEFVWAIPGDQNRAEDGLELRLDFRVKVFESLPAMADHRRAKGAKGFLADFDRSRNVQFDVAHVRSF